MKFFRLAVLLLIAAVSFGASPPPQNTDLAVQRIVSELNYTLRHLLCEKCRGQGYLLARRPVTIGGGASRGSRTYAGGRVRRSYSGRVHGGVRRRTSSRRYPLPKQVMVVCDRCGGTGVDVNSKSVQLKLERIRIQIAQLPLTEEQRARIDERFQAIENVGKLAEQIKYRGDLTEVPDADDFFSIDRWVKELKTYNQLVPEVVNQRNALMAIYLQVFTKGPVPAERAWRLCHFNRAWPFAKKFLESEARSLASENIPGQAYTWQDMLSDSPPRQISVPRFRLDSKHE